MIKSKINQFGGIYVVTVSVANEYGYSCLTRTFFSQRNAKYFAETFRPPIPKAKKKKKVVIQTKVEYLEKINNLEVGDCFTLTRSEIESLMGWKLPQYPLDKRGFENYRHELGLVEKALSRYLKRTILYHFFNRHEVKFIVKQCPISVSNNNLRVKVKGVKNI